VVKGVVTTQHVFVDPQFDVDPLLHNSLYEVHHLETLRQVHEVSAARMHVDFHRGMFVKTTPPAHVPDEDKDNLCFLAIRTEEILVVKLKGRPVLAPKFAADLAALPDK
jgi:hypothetical protein